MRVVERLKYVNHYRDRHGRERWYFRHAGQPQIALPSPKSPAFHEAYNAALAACKLRPIGIDRSALGSLSAAIGAYYTDNSFLVLAESSRAMRRRILERLRTGHGDKPLASLERRAYRRAPGETEAVCRPQLAQDDAWADEIRGRRRPPQR